MNRLFPHPPGAEKRPLGFARSAPRWLYRPCLQALKGRPLMLTAICLALFILLGWIWISASYPPAAERLLPPSMGHKAMVVVAHQDDAVIICGGYCSANLDAGGDLLVVYMADGWPGHAPAKEALRRAEAHQAWSLVGLPEENLVFFGYDDVHGLSDASEVRTAICRVSNLIKAYDPDIIFTSSYENGHYQHDVTNFVVSAAWRHAAEDCPMFEGPEYNLFFSPSRSLEKWLQAMSRFIPFYEYKAPPQFVQDRPLYEFPLDRDLRMRKKSMLMRYASQDVPWLLSRFTLRERFQRYEGYDYSEPPFPYPWSALQILHWLSRIPGFSMLVNRAFGPLEPVHPTLQQNQVTYSLAPILQELKGSVMECR